MPKVTQKYALLSVFDKTGILELAKELESLGYSIISTGGTAKALQEANIKVIPIQEVTGNPESFDGRVKTISFQIEGGILFDRTNPDHAKQASKLGVMPIDIVVCNLYPFEKTVEKQNVNLDDAIENIDVGGPTMLRSAAKNFKNVLVVCDPSDYAQVLESLKNKKVTEEIRMRLAQKTFEHLSFYDSQIAQYFRLSSNRHPERSREGSLANASSNQLRDSSPAQPDQNDTFFPEELTIPGRKIQDLRWGDNPHQLASMYLRPGVSSPFKNLKKLAGRDLSGTNLTDLSVGLEAVRLFKQPSAAIIKHNTPCGIAVGKTASQALERAIESDPESAFGGTIVVNRPLDQKCVEVVAGFKASGKGVFDIIAGTDVPQKVADSLTKVRSSLGVYSLGELGLPQKEDISFKEIVGGFMLQSADWDYESNYSNWKVVTKKKPTKHQMDQMKTAWTMIRRIRSNAVIVVDKDLPMTRGIGTGQTSRFRATKIGLDLAKDYTKGAILASDSFFPFDDSVRLAAEYGISCVIQQGGSIKDEDSIKAADELGLVMVFTNERLFWHY